MDSNGAKILQFPRRDVDVNTSRQLEGMARGAGFTILHPAELSAPPLVLKGHIYDYE